MDDPRQEISVKIPSDANLEAMAEHFNTFLRAVGYVDIKGVVIHHGDKESSSDFI